MAATVTHTFKANGKELIVQAVNVQGEAAPKIPKGFSPIFSEIAPLLRKKRQVVYISDDSHFGLGPGKSIPGAFAVTAQRILIYPNRWPVDQKQLTDAFAHEMHHLARGQNGFWYESLGYHLALDGLACLYAERATGLRPPWIRRRLPTESIKRAKRQWEDRRYDEWDWFRDPKGSMGRWAGYRLGYELAKQCFKNGFDLKESVTMKPDKLKPFLDGLATNK